MDLKRSGCLLKALRTKKGMTQKQVAEKLNIQPKTVSKWETGHGFPDTSLIKALADILEVSSDVILNGNIPFNREEAGNLKRIKHYVCPYCGSFMEGVGEMQISCCGKQLTPLKAEKADESIKIEEIENDLYVSFDHPMEKSHFISFVSLVTYDKVITVKLYPEQDAAIRIPKMYGKIYYYCTEHGLFTYDMIRKRR